MKSSQGGVVKGRSALGVARDDRNDRAEVARADPPDVQIRQLVAGGFDGGANLGRQGAVVT